MIAGQKGFHHVFEKDGSVNHCSLCMNAWPSTDGIKCKYQSCKTCGISVHSSCRTVALHCIGCKEDQVTSPSALVALSDPSLLCQASIEGRILLKLLHAYDISVTSGSLLYGLVKFSHKKQIFRTETAESGHNDCVWGGLHDGLTGTAEKSQVSLSLNPVPNKVDEILQDMVVEVSIWSSFLGLFDTELAVAEINLWPLLLYPNRSIERWFVLTNHSTADDTLPRGKLLLKLEFIPTDQSLKSLLDTNSSHTLTAAPLEGTDEDSVDEDYDSDNDPVERIGQRIDWLCGLSASKPRHNRPERLLSSPTSTDADSNSSGQAQRGLAHVQSRLDLDIIDALTAPEPSSGTVSISAPLRPDGLHPSTVRGSLIHGDDSEEGNDSRSDDIIIGSAGGSAANSSHGSQIGSGAVESRLDPDSVHSITPSIPESAGASALNVARRSSGNNIAVHDLRSPSLFSFEAAYGGFVNSSEHAAGVLGDFLYGKENIRGLKSVSMDDTVLPVDDGLFESVFRGRQGSRSGRAIDRMTAVGYMHIHLISVFKSLVQDAADGDHYVMAVVTGDEEGQQQEFKTKSVFRSASPVFNAKWKVKMSHFRSTIVFYLMEANTHRRVGKTSISCFQIMQRDVDQQRSDWRNPRVERYSMKDPGETKTIGHFSMRVAFEENLDGLYLDGCNLIEAADSPPEQLSVQRLGVHIARFSAIIGLINSWFAEYDDLMAWKDPLQTFIALLGFLYFVLRVSSDYALSGILFVIVALMTRMLLRRKAGRYVTHYIEKGGDTIPKRDYRPVAKLKVSVLGFRKIAPASSMLSSDGGREHPAKPTVKVSYKPMLETLSASKPAGTEAREYLIGGLGASVSALRFCVPEQSQGVSRLVSNIVGSSESTHRDFVLHNMNDVWPIPADGMDALRVCSTSSSGTSSGNSSVTGGNQTLKNDSPDICLVYPILQPIVSKLKIPEIKDGVHQSELGGQNSTSSSPEKDENDAMISGGGKEPRRGHGSTTGQNQDSSSSNSASGSDTLKSIFLPWEQNEGVVRLTLQHRQHSSFIDAEEEFISLPIRDIVKLKRRVGPSSSSPSTSVSPSSSPAASTAGTAKGLTTSSVIASTAASADSVSDDPSKPVVYEFKRWVTATRSAADLPQVESVHDLDLFAYDSASSILMSVRDKTPERKAAGSRSANGNTRRGSGSSDHSSSSSARSGFYAKEPGTEVFVRIQLELPSKRSTTHPTIDETEISSVIQHLMIGKEETESSTISVLWNMRDNVAYVQNLMNWLLDLIESSKNILNWTSPAKTYPLFMLIVLIWLLTVFVPGWIIMLVWGLYQFFFVFLPIPEGRQTTIRLLNMLKSIPNDDDLAEIYSEARTAYVEEKQAQWHAMEKVRKMQWGLPTLWHGAVSIKTAKDAVDWARVFMLLQGVRLVWWATEQDYDLGKEATGQLLLHGHAGATQPSPVEIRQIGDESRLVAVFGKDTTGLQQRLSILCETASQKTQLVGLIDDLTGKSPTGRSS